MSATRTMKDNKLIETLKSKVDNERRLAVEILELLQQVQDRMLHLKMGYPSLLAFCVQELKYSESTAYRRISALRLSADVPELKEQLQSGELTFQAVAQVHTFLNQEKKHNRKTYSAAEKKDLVKEVTSKNSRQIDQLLAEKSPSLPKPETSRQVTATARQVVITISAELDAKLDELRSRYSHKNPNPTLSELMELMADEILGQEVARQQRAQKRFAAKAPPMPAPPAISLSATHSNSPFSPSPNAQSRLKPDAPLTPKPNAPFTPRPNAPSSLRPEAPFPIKAISPSVPQSLALSVDENVRHRIESKTLSKAPAISPQQRTNRPELRPRNPRQISATVRYEVRMRSGGRCCYVDPSTGKGCDSRHRLEIEHIQPVALGGSSDISNLRLACRNHNSYFAHQAGLANSSSKSLKKPATSTAVTTHSPAKKGKRHGLVLTDNAN